MWLIISVALSEALRPEPSLGPRTDNVIIPLDLTQLFCPGFTLAAGHPSGFTTGRVGCWGGGSPVESLQSHFILTMSHWSSGLPFASRHEGPGFKSPGGYLCETGILLLVLSRYRCKIIPFLEQLQYGADVCWSSATVPTGHTCECTYFLQIVVFLNLTLSLTAHLMLLISLQSYKLAPPPKKKKTLCKLKTILMMSWGPICNLPYLLCKYFPILWVPVFSCLTCGPMAEAP